MIRTFFLLSAISFSFSLGATLQTPSLLEEKQRLQNDDEITTMNHLLEITAQQLEVQKQIKLLMVDFQKQKDAFIKGNQTKAHASAMVRTARQIFDGITTHHLQHLFSQDYLDELVFFSSIAGKNKMK